MSSLSQFMGSGGSQVGDVQFFHDSGTLIKKPNGEQWLRSGVVALASAFPAAAGIEHVMAHGVSRVAVPGTAYTGVTGYAANGAGAAVAVIYSSSTFAVWVTADYGATWAVAGGTIPSGVNDVCWTGARFVLVGNTANQISCSYSTTGASFTAGGTAAGVTMAVQSARIASNGSLCVIACGGSNVAQVATTVDGATLTARSLQQAMALPRIACLPALGAAQWLICDTGNSNGAQSTSADGSAWATRATPTNGINSLVAGSGKFILGNWYSTTGTNGSWVSYSVPGNYGGAYNSSAPYEKNYSPGINPSITNFSVTHDGYRFLIASHATAASQVGAVYVFAYTTDFANFTYRQIAFLNGQGSTAIVPLPCGDGLIFLPADFSGAATSISPSGASYDRNWFTSSTYVGVPVVLNQQTYNGAGSTVTGGAGKLIVGYVRVK